MILGTTKQMQQTCAAALASPDSKKTQGTPEAAERKSALAFYSALRPVHAGGAGAAVSTRSKGREQNKICGSCCSEVKVWRQHVCNWWCSGHVARNQDARERQANMMQQVPACLPALVPVESERA